MLFPCFGFFCFFQNMLEITDVQFNNHISSVIDMVQFYQSLWLYFCSLSNMRSLYPFSPPPIQTLNPLSGIYFAVNSLQSSISDQDPVLSSEDLSAKRWPDLLYFQECIRGNPLVSSLQPLSHDLSTSERNPSEFSSARCDDEEAEDKTQLLLLRQPFPMKRRIRWF